MSRGKDLAGLEPGLSDGYYLAEIWVLQGIQCIFLGQAVNKDPVTKPCASRCTQQAYLAPLNRTDDSQSNWAGSPALVGHTAGGRYKIRRRMSDVGRGHPGLLHDERCVDELLCSEAVSG